MSEKQVPLSELASITTPIGQIPMDDFKSSRKEGQPSITFKLDRPTEELVQLGCTFVTCLSNDSFRLDGAERVIVVRPWDIGHKQDKPLYIVAITGVGPLAYGEVSGEIAVIPIAETVKWLEAPPQIITEQDGPILRFEIWREN